jgi:hypothetical protein
LGFEYDQVGNAIAKARNALQAAICHGHFKSRVRERLSIHRVQRLVGVGNEDAKGF